MSAVATSDRLASLFRPRSIALVGASDKSLFSVMAYSNIERFGFQKRTFLVNPRSPVVHGQHTVSTLVGIDHDVDAALLMVPRAVMHDTLTELAEAGVRNALVLSADYAEAGDEGRRAQEALVEHAEKLDMLLLGPNHLGFANLVEGIPLIGMPDFSATAGSVALISQSGGSISSMAQFASLVGVDFSYLVTLGNEAMISAGNVLEYMVDDPHTKSVAMFIESIRDPEAFRRAALRARDAGKAIVVLKAGSSELGARAAIAHTGSIVGDDAVTDAVFRDLGVIRVHSIEEMIVTAGTAAHLGAVPAGALGFVTHSGGACDILADTSERWGAEIATLSQDTLDAMTEVLPAYASASNPVDVTGAGVNNPVVIETCITAMADDPAVAVVAVVNSLPWEEGDQWTREPMTRGIGRGMQSASVPAVFVNQVVTPLSARTRQIMTSTGIDWVIPGIEHAVSALGAIQKWSDGRRNAASMPAWDAPSFAEAREWSQSRGRGPWSEQDARELLVRAGIPFVPASVAHSAEEAVAMSARWEGPLVVKLISAEVAHKSDIGGVLLGVEGNEQLRAAYTAAEEAAASVGASSEGVLICPQRGSGLEILLGVTRDAVWGSVLTVGLGGIYTELLRDVSTIPLPASPRQVEEAIRRLRGAALLEGVRGSQPLNVPELADIAARLGALAVTLGEQLEAIEINPLRAVGDGWEALDALVVWSDK